MVVFQQQVDQAVSNWVDRGYTLVSAHPYASEHDTIHMVYVLVKYPVYDSKEIIKWITI